MSNDRLKYIRAKLFIEAAELATPLIRNHMLEDRAMCKELGLKITGEISLNPSGPEFNRETLVDAVKSATSADTKVCDVIDRNGDRWRVEVVGDAGNPGLVLRDAQRAIRIDDLALLSENKGLRLGVFDAQSREVNLPKDSAGWRETLEARALDGDELASVSEEMSDNPIPRLRLIDARLSEGGVGADALVPRSLRYYERLCGAVGAQTTMEQYSAEVLDEFIAGLINWNRIEGAKLALLLAGHPSVIPLIEKVSLSCAEMGTLLQWALDDGDLVSRAALVEIALKRGECVEESKALSELIDIFIEPSKEDYDQYELFSSAFLATYGELALTRTGNGKPVFWRRLAAMAQASIICRAVKGQRRKLDKFVSWMREIRPTEFAMQCYVDYRTDPRWMCDFALAHQLLNEFGGRVVSTARVQSENVEKFGLTAKVIGDASGSLASKLTPLLTILSGPLEGGVPSVGELQPEETERLRSDLTMAGADVQTFHVVVSAVLVAKLPPEFAALATKAIQRAQYRLDRLEDSNMLGTSVRALAQFAAVSKSVELADAIFILIRNYRRNFPDELPLAEAFTAGIIACASRSDFREWCKAVGDFINDFAFGRLTKEEADYLFRLVGSLCNIVPELWATAGEGVAAIESVAY